MTDDAEYLLDASALLALLHREPGWEAVATIIGASALSTVNLSEVLQKAASRGIAVDDLDLDLRDLGVDLVPFGVGEAKRAARLWLDGHASLSFGDRACIATAAVRELKVVTADRAWGRLKLPVQVKVIR
ncbi:MAG TPA: PIN domain-containing protein [candidate division Zixibacteria bacterium]|nr:PIN domain-containing protein [candidate division Zixibacteria bacterium]